METNPHVWLSFDKVRNPLRLPRKTTFLRVRLGNVLRAKNVHFFDISTSKSGPNLVCFVHFDLECASRHMGVHFFDSAPAA